MNTTTTMDTGFRAGTTADAWVRDEQDAVNFLEEIMDVVGDIADARLSQDDEYAKSDNEKLWAMADLAAHVQEFIRNRTQ